MKNFGLVIVSLLLGASLVWFLKPCKTEFVPGESDTIFVENIVRDTILSAPVTLVKTETITDTIETTIYKPILSSFDTLTALAEYLTTKTYSDTLRDDEVAFIFLTEKVYRSSIIERDLVFESRCVDMVVYQTAFNNGFYYGGRLNTRMEFELNLAYQRNNSIFIGGVDPASRALSFGYLRKF